MILFLPVNTNDKKKTSSYCATGLEKSTKIYMPFRAYESMLEIYISSIFFLQNNRAISHGQIKKYKDKHMISKFESKILQKSTFTSKQPKGHIILKEYIGLRLRFVTHPFFSFFLSNLRTFR